VSAWRWVREEVVYAVHDRQLAEHGGLPGVRDEGSLEGALARPRNLAAYEGPDAAALAASYACGIVRNHPFADGNKRTGWVVARLFLADNKFRLQLDPADAVRTMEAVVSGTLSESELAQWFRKRILSRPKPGR
jgi:death-on-curing protein